MTLTSAKLLYDQLGFPDANTIVDVRTDEDIAKQPRLIPGAIRGATALDDDWLRGLPRTHRILVYCVHGGERSTKAAEAIAALGFPVSTLEGGLQAWIEAGYATIRQRPELIVPGGSRWVTRERPKIDRLACPWLVRRFIDPHAHFFYTPAHRVRAEAEALRAQPYDIADVTFSHRGPQCSFDAFLEEFDLRDPILAKLADIVRAADTGELDASREAPGLLAVSLGLSSNIRDDVVLLEQAMPIYDALYTWCKRAHMETHSWPKKSLA
jgi:rhodanese-related sulfurtransferase